MKLFSIVFMFVSIFGLIQQTSAQHSNGLVEYWKSYIYEPLNKSKYLDSSPIYCRGEIYANPTNNLKDATVVVEVWHQEAGKTEWKMVGGKNYATNPNGGSSGFALEKLNLKAGSAWIGIKAVDGDGNILTWTINNFTIEVTPPGPIPLPENP